jgi:hypothetical protein
LRIWAKIPFIAQLATLTLTNSHFDFDMIQLAIVVLWCSFWGYVKSLRTTTVWRKH